MSTLGSHAFHDLALIARPGVTDSPSTGSHEGWPLLHILPPGYEEACKAHIGYYFTKVVYFSPLSTLHFSALYYPTAGWILIVLGTLSLHFSAAREHSRQHKG